VVGCTGDEEAVPYDLVARSRISVAEGEVAEVEFELDPWPEDDFEVTFGVDADSEVVIEPTSVMFSGGARRTRTITFEGLADGRLDGAQEWTLTARARGRTWAFDGVTRDADQARLAARVDGPCEEGGAPCTVVATLSAEPVGRVALEVGLPGEGFELVSSQPPVFAPGQTQVDLTLRAIQDDFVTHPDENVLTLSLTDLELEGLWAQAPGVMIPLERISDDVATLVTPERSVVPEGDRTRIPVRLGARPREDVLVPVAIEGTSTTTVGPATLTFTSSNWSTPQYVEVATVDDALAFERSDTLVFGPTVSRDDAFAQMARRGDILVEDGVCGNGVVDGLEACDVGDGVTLECDYGEVECRRCSAACEWVDGTVTGFCGDGVVQGEESELCDAGSQPSLECAYGETSCTRCDASCDQVEGVVTGFCGDGVLHTSEGEQCDVSAFTNTCQDLGFDYGEMACDVGTCGEDASGCFSWVDIHAMWGCSCLERHDGLHECWGSLFDQNHDVCEFVHGRSGELVIGMGKVCELDAQGRIVACNADYQGFDPAPPSTAFSSLSLAKDGGCGITTGGQIECWGDIYDPAVHPQHHVVPPTGIFEQAFAGEYDGCAIDAQGAATCWSFLGNPDLSPRYHDPVFSAPVQDIGFLRTGTINSRQMCALLTNGALECLTPAGYDEPADLGVPGAYTALKTYRSSGCALRTSGELECWGVDTDGMFAPPPGPFDTVDVGYRHGCGRRTTGEYVCWGNDSSGETIVPLDEHYEAVSYVGTDGCVIDSNLELKCFGALSGDQTALPPGPFSRVELNTRGGCAIRVDDELVCFGDNPNQTIMDAPHGADVVDFEFGSGYGCAVHVNGALECFGQDTYGVGILNPPAGTFVDVALVRSVGCALRTDGTIACWGASQHSNLTTENPPAGTFTQLVAVEAGYDMCALDTAGQATCWGHFLAALPGTFDSIFIVDNMFCGRSGGVTTCDFQPHTFTSQGQIDWWAARPPLSGLVDLDYPCGVFEDGALTCWGLSPHRKPLDR
jgi:hypothetical protein